MVGYRDVAEGLVEIYDNNWEDNPRMKEVCICGVEMVLSNLVNTMLVIVIATIFCIQKEVIVFFFTFGALRLFAGGGHAKNHLQCITTYILMMLISIGLAKCFAVTGNAFLYGGCILGIGLSLIVNIKYAAMQKELGEVQRISFRKRAFKVMGIIYGFMLVLLMVMQNVEALQIKQDMKEILFIQIFALIAQSIFLNKGKDDCVKRKK